MAMPAPDRPTLRLRTLGAALLERQIDEAWAPTLRGGKPLALLIYLSTLDGRVASRESLADLLWGDEAPDRSRASLRQAVYALRQAVGDAVLHADRDHLAVKAGALPCDRAAFLEASRRGDFDAMLATYGGSFCDGLPVGGADEFERWMRAERLRLERLLLDQAAGVIPTRIAAGETEAALVAARALDRYFPERSEVVVLLFDALVATGGRLEAVERLSAHGARLASQEVSMPPALAERLARARRAATEGPALPMGPAMALSLVGQQLVGREALLGELSREAELARGGRARTVVLTGPAGVGKTRVLDELEARLRLRGARVVRVGVQQAMQDVEYAALVELVRALAALPGALGIAGQSAGAVVGVVPELAERFSSAAEHRVSVRGAEGVARLQQALADLMASVSEERLVVVMLDNLHHADAASLRVLSGTLLTPTSRLLVLGTSRHGLGASALPASIAIEVLPLDAEGIAAMLRSVAIVPELPWMDELVLALERRSLGVPQVVLAMLRSLGAARLLRVEEGAWTSDRPEALLAMAQETAGTSALLADVDPLARLALEVLATWGRPMEERDFIGTMALTSARPSVEALRDRLRQLEALGLVQSRDVAWALAHDTVADELRSARSAVLTDSPAELLFAYWRDPDRLSVTVLEQLALIAGRDDSAAMAVRLGRAALTAPRIRAAGIRGRALARRVARMSGRPEWESKVMRGLGFWGRQSERTRLASVIVATLALAMLAWVAERLQPRVIISTPAMAEQPGLELPVHLVVQPRVHIENGFGHTWTWPVPLRVRSDLAAVFGDTTRVSADGTAQFERLALMRRGIDSIPRPVHLVVSGPWYVRPGRAPVVGLTTGELLDDWRVTAVEVNGRSLGDSLIVDVAPGDSLRVDLTFEYTTVQATANYVVGAAAMWEPRERASIRLAGLPRPVREAWRHVTFAVRAPERAGAHHIAVVFDLEDTVEHSFSNTNWQFGAPSWYDGNDLQDQPPAFFDSLRVHGIATAAPQSRRPLQTRQADLRLGDSVTPSLVWPEHSRRRAVVGRAILVRVAGGASDAR